MKENRVGSPPGYYCHWLPFALPPEFLKAYRFVHHFRYHNYRFYRYFGRTLIDEFIVVRTSKRCYRVIYFNNDFNHYQYCSFRNYRECAAWMKAIYYVFKRLPEPKSRDVKKKSSS